MLRSFLCIIYTYKMQKKKKKTIYIFLISIVNKNLLRKITADGLHVYFWYLYIEKRKY